MFQSKKFFLSALVLCYFITFEMFAQLAMKLESNRKNYLTYETVYVKLTMKNQTGHPLVFGKRSGLKGDLIFNIDNYTDKKPKQIGKVPVIGKVIPPGKIETVIVPLSKMYDITTDGKYSLKAIIKHAQLPDSYQSNMIDFNVTPGVKVWDAIVGVPTVGDLEDGKKIEKRIYEIRSFFDGADNVYCLIVQDENYIYGVARIGVDIGNLRPQCMVDRFSKLHILIQASPSVFSYYVYDTDCHLEEKETYKKSKSTPCLVENPDTGRIFVAGGIKAREGIDFAEESDEQYLN